MGVAVNATNHTVYATESATKSVTVSLQNVFAYSTNGHNYVGVISALAGGVYVQTSQVSTGTEAYDAGQNSVYVSNWSVDKSDLPTVTVTVTLSNGVVRSHSFNV